MSESMHKIKVSVAANGMGRVDLDGVDITMCVRGISFKAEAGETAEVTIRFFGDVEVDAETERVLAQCVEPGPDVDDLVETLDARFEERAVAAVRDAHFRNPNLFKS